MWTLLSWMLEKRPVSQASRLGFWIFEIFFLFFSPFNWVRLGCIVGLWSFFFFLNNMGWVEVWTTRMAWVKYGAVTGRMTTGLLLQWVRVDLD